MKQHVEGRAKQERAKVRKSIGSLKQLTVQPKTRARYDAARAKFYKFLKSNQLTLPKRRDELDGILAEYIEHLWETGEGRGLASDTVAGIQDLDPKLKGHLALTWRLLKTWHMNEVPNRAPPLPESALFAMVGWSIFHDSPDFGLSLLLGFYGLLRTGEFHAVTASSVFMNGPTKAAVVSLGLTKGGKRMGAAESITCHVHEVLRRLWRWKCTASPQDLLVPSSSQWRTMFSRCLAELKLDDFGFRPYSLRRGGATFPDLFKWRVGHVGRNAPSNECFETIFHRFNKCVEICSAKTWANSGELFGGTWNTFAFCLRNCFKCGFLWFLRICFRPGGHSAWRVPRGHRGATLGFRLGEKSRELRPQNFGSWKTFG